MGGEAPVEGWRVIRKPERSENIKIDNLQEGRNHSR